ncbi:MAG TPA: LLM class F420-dependent oxidoreductase [Rubrobacteraceae bacterium]
MADSSLQQRENGRNSRNSRNGYPDRSVLGGEVGLWSSNLNSVPAPQTREAVAEIEELGYAALWFGEALGREAFTNASMFLSATSRLVVATGIANIFVRDAWATNAAAKTLAGAFPERFVLGLGVSHRPMVEMRGHDYRSPLSIMRAYLEDMREARFDAAPPEHDSPWLLAALGPKMLELSRDLADGAHPYLATPQHTAEAREILGDGPLLAVEQAVAPTRDREEALRLARSHLSRYLQLPNYRNSWLRQGFQEEDLSGDGSERLAEGLVAWGSESDIRERISEHLSAGADQVCVQVVTGGPTDDIRDRWRSLAPALLG